MTIQRLYSLPNCKLSLEGWGDDTGTSPTGRPLLSMLVNAECSFTGQDQVLSGGREFLDSLAIAANRYAQEFLSGVHRPTPRDSDRHAPELVKLEKIDLNLHRLIYQPQPSEKQHAGQPGSTVLEIGTVQLFDLVEAIDQLFADSQTLPDLRLDLAPVPKRYVKAQEPTTQRVLPATLGVSSLAVAAIAFFFFLPVPEFRRPEPASDSGSEQIEPASDAASPDATGANNAAAIDAEAAEDTDDADSAANSPLDDETLAQLLSTAPEITDTDTIEDLTVQLQSQLADAWEQDIEFDENLIYRVGVAENGDILGFRYVNEPALDYVEQTPLLDLRYNPVEANPEEPIGQFRVVFTPERVVEVSSWYGRPTASASANDEDSSPSPVSGPEVRDSDTLRTLTSELQGAILDTQESRVATGEELTYQVSFNEEGQVLAVDPINDAASTYLDRTPLPQLLDASQSEGIEDETPQAPFRVVFTPGGSVEVSPWNGY